MLACSNPQHGTPFGEQPDAAQQAPLDAAGALDAETPATCNGYEPCGVNAVVVPTGYTLRNAVAFDDYGGIYGSCSHWEDCGMWNTHFTSNWDDANGNPVSIYYNRMAGGGFPWPLSRYEIDVAPKKIQYASFHILAPGEPYKFSDGTMLTQTERSSGTTTCFKRGARMEHAELGNLGGTGNAGKINWNISVLPGDMGNSGNASICQGDQNTLRLLLTADPAVAAAAVDSNGNPTTCLLREGVTYYMNFMSSGTLGQFDCTTGSCSMGGFVLANFQGSDSSAAPQVQVPCP